MTARLFLMLAAVAAVLGAQDPRELTGRVVDATTGEPIAHARLSLRFSGSQAQPTELNVLSDPDGSFHITNPPNLAFQLSCEKSGYLPANQYVAATQGDAKPAPVSLRMVAQAVIEGTVVDDRDFPAENTYLQLFRQDVNNGHREYSGAQGGGTDETGSVRISGLPTGRYYISIVPRVSAARYKGMAYPLLFYPGVTDVAAAQPLDLKAGDDLQIHIKLPVPIPAYQIRGVIVAAGGNMTVSLTRLPATSAVFGSPGELKLDSKTHTFTISHVPPGIYELRANVYDQNRMEASTTVTVGDRDIDGIRLEPAETSLDGVLRIEGAPAPQRMSIALQSQRGGNSVPVESDGKFHFTNLAPGKYRVVPQLPFQGCYGSILQDGHDARDGVTVAAGAAPPLEVVMTTHCGGVDGTISDHVTMGLTAVLLRKTDAGLVLEQQTYINPMGAGATPQFHLLNVPPGDYVLYVWPGDARIEYADPEYMRQFDSYVQPVTITADNKTAVTVDRILRLPTGK